MQVGYLPISDLALEKEKITKGAILRGYSKRRFVIVPSTSPAGGLCREFVDRTWARPGSPPPDLEGALGGLGRLLRWQAAQKNPAVNVLVIVIKT